MRSDPRPFEGCFTTLYPGLSEVRIIDSRLRPNCGALRREGQRWRGCHWPHHSASRPEIARLLADQSRADTTRFIQPAGELRRLYLLLAGTFSGAGSLRPPPWLLRPRRAGSVDWASTVPIRPSVCAEHAKGLIARVKRVQFALQLPVRPQAQRRCLRLGMAKGGANALATTVALKPR